MRVIVVALFALLLGSLAVAQTFSSLEERMSEEDFRAAGLHKLSPEELAHLNAWLAGRVATAPAGTAAAPPTTEDRRGFENTGRPETIVSRVAGEFRGWDGRGTRIELENGQVWETTDPAARLAVQLHNPSVRIEPGFMNGWFLQVEGYNAKARVKRVR